MSTIGSTPEVKVPAATEGAALDAPGAAHDALGAAPDAPGAALNAPGAAPDAPGAAPNALGAAHDAPGSAHYAPDAADDAPRTALNVPSAALDAPRTAHDVPRAAPPHGLLAHSLASRFLFLQICISLVLTALAYGTVHYWALAVFAASSVLLLFLWVADGWRLGTLRVSRNILQLPLLGLVALGLFQLLPLRSGAGGGGDATRTLSLDPFSTRLVVVQLIALLIFFAATLVFVDTPPRLRIIVRTIAIFGFLLAVFGMTQSFTSPTKIYWVRELAQSTAFGPFINRHHFAGYMELSLAIPLGLLFSGAIQGEKKLLYIFAVAMMGIALILTNSRGGIISLVAEVLFLVVIVGIRRQQHVPESEGKQTRARGGFARAALALALVIGILGGTVLLGGEAALTRFVGTVNTDDPTTGRAHFWSVTLDIIRAHPLAGTGLGAFGVVYTRYDSRNGLFRLEQAHNDYLQLLSDGGVIGAALGLFFVVALFRMGFARRETRDTFRRGVATGALAGCFAVLVHSFFDFTLHTTANALLFLVLAALGTIDGRVEHVEHRRRRRRRRHATSYTELTDSDVDRNSKTSATDYADSADMKSV